MLNTCATKSPSASVLAIALILLTATGCSAAETEDSEFHDDENAELSSLLARVSATDDTVLEFRLTSSGALIISEDAPVGAPKRLQYLLRSKATPLEAFLAVSQGEFVAPEELIEHHDHVTSRRRHGAHGSQPRQIYLPTDDEFRTLYPGYVSTDCSYANDSEWWTGIRADLGWNWSWYFAGAIPGFPENHKSTPDTPTTENFFSHVCTYSKNASTTVKHDLYDKTAVEWLWKKDGIPVGYRSTVWTTGLEASFSASANFYGGGGASVKLGGIAQ